MPDPQLLSLLALIVASLAFVIGGVLAYNRLRQPQDYPREAQIEAALLPVLYHAIFAAFKLSDEALDELGKTMDGVDKKAVADYVYRLLPDKVGDFDLGLVKSLVPQERFARLVQDAYDRANTFYLKNRAQFDKLFCDWMDENAPEMGDDIPADDTPVHTRAW